MLRNVRKFDFFKNLNRSLSENYNRILDGGPYRIFAFVSFIYIKKFTKYEKYLGLLYIVVDK